MRKSMHVAPFACPHCHRPALGPSSWSHNNGSARDMEACLELDGITPHVDVCAPWKEKIATDKAMDAAAMEIRLEAAEAERIAEAAGPSPAEFAGRIVFLNQIGARRYCARCGARVWWVARCGLIDERWRRHDKGVYCGEFTERNPIDQVTIHTECAYCRDGTLEAGWMGLWGSTHWNTRPLRRHACYGSERGRRRRAAIKEALLVVATIGGVIGAASLFGVAQPMIDAFMHWLLN